MAWTWRLDRGMPVDRPALDGILRGWWRERSSSIPWEISLRSSLASRLLTALRLIFFATRYGIVTAIRLRVPPPLRYCGFSRISADQILWRDIVTLFRLSSHRVTNSVTLEISNDFRDFLYTPPYGLFRFFAVFVRSKILSLFLSFFSV